MFKLKHRTCILPASNLIHYRFKTSYFNVCGKYKLHIHSQTHEITLCYLRDSEMQTLFRFKNYVDKSQQSFFFHYVMFKFQSVIYIISRQFMIKGNIRIMFISYKMIIISYSFINILLYHIASVLTDVQHLTSWNFQDY